jgi:hypothetical protein
MSWPKISNTADHYELDARWGHSSWRYVYSDYYYKQQYLQLALLVVRARLIVAHDRSPIYIASFRMPWLPAAAVRFDEICTHVSQIIDQLAQHINYKGIHC